MKCVEVHALYVLPNSAMNCNFLGDPKQCMFGGDLRYYLASQSWSRPAKNDFQKKLDGQPQIDYSSRCHQDKIKQILIHQYNLSEEDAQLLSDNYSLFVFKKDESKKNNKKNKRNGKKKGDQEQLSTTSDSTSADSTKNVAELVEVDEESGSKIIRMFSNAEISFISQCLAEFYKEKSDSLKSNKDLNHDDYKDAIKVIRKKMTPDNFKGGTLSCFFGRMFADRSDFDKQATIMRSHMFTTHGVTTSDKIDDFIAQDDILSMNGENGAGHMNSKEFANGCYYKCFVLDYDEVSDKNHLAGIYPKEEINKIVKDMILSMIKALPSGKKNSFFANTFPSFVMINVVDDNLPISYASAFENAVQSKNGSGFLAESINRLAHHYEDRQQWGNYKFSGMLSNKEFKTIKISGCDHYDNINRLVDVVIEKINE